MRRALAFIKNYWSILLVGLALTVLLIGFLAGYRIAPGLAIVRNGTVAVTNLPPGTNIFTDLSRLHTVGGTGATSLRLSPGQHTVIVDADGFQPWDELFDVTSGTTTTLSPILVPVEVRARELLGAQKTEAQKLVYASKLPSKTAPLMVADGCVSVYVSGRSIVAEATSSPAASCEVPAFLCEDSGCAPTIVQTPAEALRSVIPYPGRNDALVIAAGGLIYVLELDPREPQFFAPLYKGPYATAITWSASSIAGFDGTKAFEIPLHE